MTRRRPAPQRSPLWEITSDPEVWGVALKVVSILVYLWLAFGAPLW